MAEKKSKWRLLLDGKPYTGGAFEEGLSLATDLYHPPGTKVIYGFTSPKAFRRWAAKSGETRAFRRGLRTLKAAQKLSESRHDRIHRALVVKTKREDQRTKKILKDRGVRSSDRAKIMSLAKQKVIGSVLLYEQTNFRGAFIRLYNLIPGPMNSYPRLSPYGFNDRAESVINTGPHPVVLCQHTYFRGSRLWVSPATSDADLGWFNNRASSVLVV